MKIYFACSITGGRKDQNSYQYLVEVLSGLGTEIPNAHITESGIEGTDALETPGYIYERDVSWILECDLVIAEVSTPSHGVGYEIGFALDHAKPVLCLYKKGIAVSKMITGNPHHLLTVEEYSDLPQAGEIVEKYLKT